MFILDIQPPSFLGGECPSDIQQDIDAANNTAAVTWDIPAGSDNSQESVNVTEIHGYQPGNRFEAGSYIVKYTIEDQNHNRGDSCSFMITVRCMITCPSSLHIYMYIITPYLLLL